MLVSIVGATGFIGSAITEEALLRGHRVVAIARHPEKIDAREGLTAAGADTAKPTDLARHISGSDACIVAVRWTDNRMEDVLAAVRASSVPRTIVVVGAGSLRMPDGRLWLDHMIAQGIAPPTSRKALEALAVLRAVDDIGWTAFSPAADIEPGERTGVFRLGGDDLLTDKNGRSRISTQDFAMAVLAEVEQPAARHKRFTVAY